MTQMQIAQELSERLTSGRQQVELHDEQGRLIGFFVPAGEFTPELRAWAETAFSEEELLAAEQESGGSTWEEIRRELEEKWPST